MPSFGGTSPFMKLFEERSKGEKGGEGGAAGKGGRDGAVGVAGKGGKEPGGRGSRPDDEGRKRKKGTSHGAGEALEERENLGGKVEAGRGKKRGSVEGEARAQQLPSKKKQKKEGEARREQARGDRGSHGAAGGPPTGESRDDSSEAGKGSVASAGGGGGLGVAEGKKKRKKRKGRHGGSKGGGAGDAGNGESDEEDEDGIRRNVPKSGNSNGQQDHGAGGGGKGAGPHGHEESARGRDAGDGKKKKKEGKNQGGSREAAGEDDDGWGGGQGKDKAKDLSNGEYPFEADDADHAETPVEAYRDIAPVLARLAEALGKTKATLRVYDPYYCAGGVVKRLAQHGFKKVYNRCEDFYKMIETGKVPEYDVLLTNPPYSSDHFDRIVRFSASSGKPWMLLVPNFIYTKDFFKLNVLDEPSQSGCMYLVPRKRYTYWTPEFLHSTKYGVSTSPFPSFWFIQCLKNTGLVRSWFNSRPQQETKHVQLAASVADLPMEVRAAFDPLKKRPNPKMRKKLAKLRKSGGARAD